MENRGSPEGLSPGEEGNSLAGKELTQAVQVALNIRPLIALERAQGCKDCISVVPGEPQVIFFQSCDSFTHLFVSVSYDFLPSLTAFTFEIRSTFSCTRSRENGLTRYWLLIISLQVQLGSHSFTFDHVFGSSAAPLAGVFDSCVKSLVEGLFHGYNATVLAYGQVLT